MKSLQELISTLIAWRASGRAQLTLLAVCPNSAAVLEAAVKAAARNRAPLLFAATLNQVDRDGGYTGWTPAAFVAEIRRCAARYGWEGPLYPCLDHGGPWLKDRHTQEHLSLDETLAEVKASLVACLEAGYALLHIDPTVDRTLPPGQPPAVETVVARTVELMAHTERARQALGLPPIAYEVGTEEVHGGLVEMARFERFLALLRAGLDAAGLSYAWPGFVVAQVGTDLHTTTFDPAAARRLYATLAPLGSLAKGHYTDWVANPADYPLTGMGGANVGPEFTALEYLALEELVRREAKLCRYRPDLVPSGFLEVLNTAILTSGRWRKWLQPDEQGAEFSALAPERQRWLLQTGARYCWADSAVVAARTRLYQNLSTLWPDPHACVVEQIAQGVEHYLKAFNLTDTVIPLEEW